MTVSPSSQNGRAAAVSARPRALGALGALAIAAACVGALIIAALAIYYGVRFYAASTLDDMEASIAAPAALPTPSAGETLIRGAVMPDGEFKPIAVVAAPSAAPAVAASTSAETSSPAQDNAPDAAETPPETAAAAPYSAPSVAASTSAETSSTAQDAPAPAETASTAQDAPAANAAAPDGRALVAAYNSLYPALATHPKYWTSPSTAGADPYAFGSILRPDGFLSVAADRGEPVGTAPDAARVKIPSIGVDSEVANLAILDFGDTRQYETPNKVVGRIPEKANPGELGRAWLFGHLESPIRGEGDVFRRLPEIPDLLRIGDPVYVEILNEAGDEFLYQITETKVVHQDALAPFVYGEDARRAMITLVACVPRLVYDHRILVIGELVGVKPAAA